jgi:heme-degrading monooxygenase HmoA
MRTMSTGYTYVWEFQVPHDALAEFERHYGPEGTWVQLFRRAPGYLETLLLQDRDLAGRYLTIDRWRSEAAYLAFRADFASEYAALDQACAQLTTHEASLGRFAG